MNADDHLVQCVRRRPPGRLDHVLEPVVEVGSELPRPFRYRNPPGRLRLFFHQTLVSFLAGAPVDIDTLVGARGRQGVERANVSAILARAGVTSVDRRVFISYRRVETEPIAGQLFESLTRLNFGVFLDTVSVDPGVKSLASLKAGAQVAVRLTQATALSVR